MSSDDDKGVQDRGGPKKPANIDPERTVSRVLRLMPALTSMAADKREGVRRAAPETKVIADALMREDARPRSRLEAAAPPVTGMVQAEAEGVATKLVTEAMKAAETLSNGAPAHSLRPSQVLALEAVVRATGRPAVRVDGNDLEDLTLYPEAAMWRLVVDNHRAAIMTACRATAAVRVVDLLAGSMTWVQGTSWLLSADTAITNRHVLFPPFGGTRLARRIPGTQTARLRKDLTVSLDFSFHDNPPSQVVYRVVDIVYVASENDPVDAALLKIEPISGKANALTLTTKPLDDLERLYVVGHPGLMQSIPKDVRKVFGDPDEKKRVSFGELMEPLVRPSDDIIHDASTIGGFSGGCVMDFLATDVTGLHYWGDTAQGNRAVSAAAIRGHPDLSRLLPPGGG